MPRPSVLRQVAERMADQAVAAYCRNVESGQSPEVAYVETIASFSTCDDDTLAAAVRAVTVAHRAAEAQARARVTAELDAMLAEATS